MQQDTGSLIQDLLDELREQRERTLLMMQDLHNLKEDIGRGFCNIDNKFKNDFVSKRELLEFEQKVTYSILGVIGSALIAILLDRFNR